MKRGIWIGLLAAAAFVVIVIANMPATWVIPAGRTQGLCASIDGSLWSGSCSGLTVSGKPMGDLNWDLHPLRLLLGKLAAHLQLVNGPASVNTDVELGFGGRVTARNLTADLPLDPKLLPLLPSTLAGSAHLDLALGPVAGNTHAAPGDGLFRTVQPRRRTHRDCVQRPYRARLGCKDRPSADRSAAACR